jgi:hypothetical protein
MKYQGKNVKKICNNTDKHIINKKYNKTKMLIYYYLNINKLNK